MRQGQKSVAVDGAEPVHGKAHYPLRFFDLPGLPIWPPREAQDPVWLSSLPVWPASNLLLTMSIKAIARPVLVDLPRNPA